MSNFKFTNEHLIIIRDKPHVLGHIAGKTKLSQIHSEWIRYLWDTTTHRAVQAHRGSYKTTAMAIGIIRWMLFNPDDRIAVVRKTFSDAAEIVKVVEQIMELSEICALFKFAHGQYPKAKVKRYGNLRYNFKRSVTPEGNVTAHGLDGSLTGRHYDKIWTDDIITLKDRISRAERERTIEMIREIYTNIVDPGKPVCASGTPWHKLDGWNHLPCEILKFPVSKLNILSEADIATKRKTTTPFLFAVNYDLEFNSENDALFKDPKYCSWEYLNEGTYAHLDSAFDGDHYCAFSLMSRMGEKKQLKGFAYPGNVKDWMPFIAKTCKSHRVKTLFTETNADKGFVADKLIDLGINVETYAEAQNKHIKISTYLYEEWENIEIANDSDDEYVNQILDYREGQEPDDAPDSAACLIKRAFPMETRLDTDAWKY